MLSNTPVPLLQVTCPRISCIVSISESVQALVVSENLIVFEMPLSSHQSSFRFQALRGYLFVMSKKALVKLLQSNLNKLNCSAGLLVTVRLAWACRYLSSLGSVLYSSPCPPVPVSYPSSLYSEGRTAYNSPSPPQSSSIWPTCTWSCHRLASYHFPGP